MENVILTQLNPNPQVSTRSIKVPAGQVGQIPVIGTSFMCLSCYNVINDTVTPASCVVKLGSIEPFTCGAGYYVNYKNFATAFSLIQVDNTRGEYDLFFDCQIGYLSEAGNVSGVGAIEIANIAQKLNDHVFDFNNPHKTTLQSVYNQAAGNVLLNLNDTDFNITGGNFQFNGSQVLTADDLTPATASAAGVVKLSTDSALESSVLIGKNESGQLVVDPATLPAMRDATASAAGVVKLSTDSALSSSVLIGKNEAGKLVVDSSTLPAATKDRFGLVKFWSDEIISASTASARVLRNEQGQMLVPVATTTQAGALVLGTSVTVGNDAGMLGRTAGGAAAVRFASGDRSGVVYLASSIDDTRVAAVPNAAQVKNSISISRQNVFPDYTNENVIELNTQNFVEGYELPFDAFIISDMKKSSVKLTINGNEKVITRAIDSGSGVNSFFYAKAGTIIGVSNQWSDWYASATIYPLL